MNVTTLQQPKQPQRCKGYIFPVKPYGYEKLLERINSEKGSEYYFGIHIDDLGNGRVGLHIPLSELADFARRNGASTIDDYAGFVNEYASLDFSYKPSEWRQQFVNGSVDIKSPQFAAILSF
jgi:hypothetical protein